MKKPIESKRPSIISKAPLSPINLEYNLSFSITM